MLTYLIAHTSHYTALRCSFAHAPARTHAHTHKVPVDSKNHFEAPSTALLRNGWASRGEENAKDYVAANNCARSAGVPRAACEARACCCEALIRKESTRRAAEQAREESTSVLLAWMRAASACGLTPPQAGSAPSIGTGHIQELGRLLRRRQTRRQQLWRSNAQQAAAGAASAVTAVAAQAAIDRWRNRRGRKPKKYGITGKMAWPRKARAGGEGWESTARPRSSSTRAPSSRGKSARPVIGSVARARAAGGVTQWGPTQCAPPRR